MTYNNIFHKLLKLKQYIKYVCFAYIVKNAFFKEIFNQSLIGEWISNLKVIRWCSIFVIVVKIKYIFHKLLKLRDYTQYVCFEYIVKKDFLKIYLGNL